MLGHRSANLYFVLHLFYLLFFCFPFPVILWVNWTFFRSSLLSTYGIFNTLLYVAILVIVLCIVLCIHTSSAHCCHLTSAVQPLSRDRLFATTWTAAHQAFLSIVNSQSLLKLMSIELVKAFNHLILCCPLVLPPSILPSIRVFSKESVLRIRWPKYWRLSFSISPSNEYSGLLSFRMDWLYLLAVQGTLKSLIQHHSSKASILHHSAFFIVLISHPYMTTGKTIALTKRTFVGKVIPLLFNMLSRLVIVSSKE